MKYPVKISKFYLFKLSLPVFFSNLAIPLVGLVDTALMGHLGSVNFLAATAIATSVITMIFWSFGFLRMGTTGMVAQSLGKGDYREIALGFLRNLCVAAIISLIIMLSKNQILLLIEEYFNTSPEIHSLIKKYISIRLLSAPAELTIYVLVGFYLGLQKTVISSFIITFFCVSNIIASSYFVLILDMNIYGVALGTVLAAYITVFIFIIQTYFFIKKEFNILPRYKKIFIPKKLLKLFNINIDIFIRTILLTFAFLWIAYQGSLLGDDYLAVNSILLQFIMIASFFLDAYAFSTEGVVGFSLGKKVKKSFLLLVKNSFKLSFFTSIVISFFYILFFKDIVDIITDIDYLRYLSYEYALWIFIIPIAASICYQFDGIFIGATQTSDMRNAMILSVLSFLTISHYFTKYYGNHGLWFSVLIFMILRSVSLKIYFSRILKKF